MDKQITRTKHGYPVTLNATTWNRADFHYLGVIASGPSSFAWAWHKDGRSIDRDDDFFDLEMPPTQASDIPPFFWLGKDALADRPLFVVSDQINEVLLDWKPGMPIVMRATRVF